MVWFNRGKHIILDRTAAAVGEPPLDLLLDRIVIGLMRAAYSPNIDTHEQYDDITTNGIVATSYIEPGNASSLQLAGKTITRNDTTDLATLDGNDLVFTAIGNGANDTFDQIVVAREQDATATEANTELVATVVVPTTLTNGGNVTLVFNAAGLIQITA